MTFCNIVFAKYFSLLVILTIGIHHKGFSQKEVSIIPIDQPDADNRIIRGRACKYWEKYMENADLSDYHHASKSAVEAFKDLKYGIRIHWGIYSMVHGKESWVLPQKFEYKPEVLAWYHDLYKAWYPSQFDANAWMKMAKENGFQFFVFTTKHHDGFSMYDTKFKVKYKEAYTGKNVGQLEEVNHHYSIMETPFKRDITRELVEAARKEGLKVGLYYSNPDWYDADFRFRKPNADKTYTPENNREAFARFRARHAGQIKELLSNYGQVDMLSLDLNMVPFTWDHMQETARMIRKLQPDVMVRWRGIGHYGDYQTPENVVPGEEDLGTMPWQVIHTLSSRDIFAYEPDERYIRDGKWIIENLIDIVAKGGNFMVGVGPDLNGAWHPKVMQALNDAGKWLEVNGEAIFKTRPFHTYRKGNFWFTQSKDKKTVYAIFIGKLAEEMKIETMKIKNIKAIQLLGHSEKIYYDMNNSFTIKIPQNILKENEINAPVAYSFKIILE